MFRFGPSVPDYFLGAELDRLSHGILRWRTVQNLRCIAKREAKSAEREGKITSFPQPEGVFEYISSRRIVVIRDKLFT